MLEFKSLDTFNNKEFGLSIFIIDESNGNIKKEYKKLINDNENLKRIYNFLNSLYVNYTNISYMKNNNIIKEFDPYFQLIEEHPEEIVNTAIGITYIDSDDISVIYSDQIKNFQSKENYYFMIEDCKRIIAESFKQMVIKHNLIFRFTNNNDDYFYLKLSNRKGEIKYAIDENGLVHFKFKTIIKDKDLYSIERFYNINKISQINEVIAPRFELTNVSVETTEITNDEKNNVIYSIYYKGEPIE